MLRPVSGTVIICMQLVRNCNNLLYDQFAGAVAHRAAYFGQGSGPVHIGTIQCDGTEQTIMDCHLNYENNCVHSEDAGVECTGENV